MIANMPHQPILEIALGLIQRERYAEARQLLEDIRDNVTAQKWLSWLEERAPAWPHEHVPTITNGQHERALLIQQHRSNLLSHDLAHVNSALEDTRAKARRARMWLVCGVLTLPLLGAGAPLLAYGLYTRARHQRRLKLLSQRRDLLLRDLEQRALTRASA